MAPRALVRQQTTAWKLVRAQTLRSKADGEKAPEYCFDSHAHMLPHPNKPQVGVPLKHFQRARVPN